MITNKTEVVAQLVGRATGMIGGLAGAWNENAPLLVGFTAAGGRAHNAGSGGAIFLGSIYRQNGSPDGPDKC